MADSQNVDISDSTNSSHLSRANSCSLLHTKTREVNRQNWAQQGTVSKKGQRLRRIKAHLKGLFASSKAESKRKPSSEREQIEMPSLSLRVSSLDQCQLVPSSDENDLETVMDLEGGEEEEEIRTVNELSSRNNKEKNPPYEKSKLEHIQFNKPDTLLVCEPMQEDCQANALIRDQATFAMLDNAPREMSDVSLQGGNRLPQDTKCTRGEPFILNVKSLEPGYQDNIPSIVDISSKHKKYLCLLRSRSESHLGATESGENPMISNLGSQSLSSLDEHQEDNSRDGPPPAVQRSEEKPSETSLTCTVSSKCRRVRRKSHPLHNLGWGEVNQCSVGNRPGGSRHGLELDLAQKVILRHRILKSIKDGDR